jgi:hypothetical protein
MLIFLETQILETSMHIVPQKVLKAIEERYKEKDSEQDAYVKVINAAVETLECRLAKAEQDLSVVEDENCFHLLEDKKIVEAQLKAFMLALTVYSDMKKLYRIEGIH